MTTKQRNATARREVQKELEAALVARVERGTVVTSAGTWAPFTVAYVTLGGKPATRITLGGRRSYSVQDAASAALSAWGFTR